MRATHQSSHTQAVTRQICLLLFILFCAVPVLSQTVAVAANARYLIDDLASAYRAASGNTIRTVVGSSGGLASQIRNGAPFDVFLSADTAYPMGLWRDGWGLDTPRVYAYGTLILWTNARIDLKEGLRALLDPAVKKIALANPQSAPYGSAAVGALKAAGLFDTLSSKIVYGESIAQVNQYVDSRAAEIGLTASSVVFAGSGRDAREWRRVDSTLYPPIPQAALLVRRRGAEAADAVRALAFYRFLFRPEARAIFRRFGYQVR